MVHGYIVIVIEHTQHENRGWMLNAKFKRSVRPGHPSRVQRIVDNRCSDKVVFVDTSYECIRETIDKGDVLVPCYKE
jgi:hypothetical protein